MKILFQNISINFFTTKNINTYELITWKDLITLKKKNISCHVWMHVFKCIHAIFFKLSTNKRFQRKKIKFYLEKKKNHYQRFYRYSIRYFIADIS